MSNEKQPARMPKLALTLILALGILNIFTPHAEPQPEETGEFRRKD
jgi:hypothetical protein